MRQMKDPAPSRLAYKLNRLMMRRWVRVFLRFGLPVLVLAAIGAIWASDPARVEGAKDRLVELKHQVKERPEFLVRMLALEDASAPVAADIREVLSMDFPISSFDLNLDQIRETVEALDAVATANVQVRSGGVLSVTVTERVPVAVWRDDAGLKLVDNAGHPVQALASRVERPELPLIVGLGANEAVTEALALYAEAGPLRPRIRGFLRVGQRRWDVVLDRDQRLLLPEIDPSAALQKALHMNAQHDVLARDVSAMDFRNPARPVLRLGTIADGGLTKTDFTLLLGTAND